MEWVAHFLGTELISRRERSKGLPRMANRSKSPGMRQLKTQAGVNWIGLWQIRSKATLANASNMLDVTWEAPDGAIIPLDGYLDPYFQEVYLQAESVPLFSKLAQHVSADALDEYVNALEGEVKKYLTEISQLWQGSQAHV